MKNLFWLILFPFSRTFARLELQRRWWHRLAVVGYGFLLLLGVSLTWLVRAEAPYRASWKQPPIVRGEESVDAISARIGRRVYSATDKAVLFAPDGSLRLVQYNLVNEAIESGGHRAVPMVFDDSFAYVPDNRASEADRKSTRL